MLDDSLGWHCGFVIFECKFASSLVRVKNESLLPPTYYVEEGVWDVNPQSIVIQFLSVAVCPLSTYAVTWSSL